MPEPITANALKQRLHDGTEIALLDVREHGQYGESHLFYAISVPYSRLETNVRRLVPQPATFIVLYDSGEHREGVAFRAATRLRAAGYTQISVLVDGIAGWRRAGFELFKGVNVPSKTFGELVEQQRHTPVMTAQALYQRQQAGDNLIVLDGRPFEEFFKMSIPGAICCPNGELALRIGELIADPQTIIVINCAGRTRSIIGAQTLLNLGIQNPVFALENGTQGWRLAGFELEQGNTRRHPCAEPSDLAKRQSSAARLASWCRVPELSAAQAQAFVDDPVRNCFVLDIRTPEEFRHGTLPGAQSAPGGQLIQANDQYVGVRRARLLIVDHEQVRAPVVASWMRQLGFEAYTLTDGIHTALTLPEPRPLPLASPESVDAACLARLISSDSVTLIDIRPSTQFRQQHVLGAQWSIRPVIGSALTDSTQAVVLMAEHYETAQLAALDLQDAGVKLPRAFTGSIEACQAAGIRTCSADNPPSPVDDIDFLFFVHDRHAGNLAASRRYLEWETGLLAQIDRDELNDFSVSPPAR
ncbi:MAG: rhodanese-like domain-containing protein [Burkholderiaceae bacterium]